jgi:hypothetical protein
MYLYPEVFFFKKEQTKSYPLSVFSLFLRVTMGPDVPQTVNLWLSFSPGKTAFSNRQKITISRSR